MRLNIRELADVLDGAMQRLSGGPKPVVASAQGAVTGAGMSITLRADLMVAAEYTKFVAAYGSIGVTPDIGLSWLLPRAVGHVRAMDLLLNGRVVDAATALSWVLLTETVASDPAGRAHEIAKLWWQPLLELWLPHARLWGKGGRSPRAHARDAEGQSSPLGSVPIRRSG